MPLMPRTAAPHVTTPPDSSAAQPEAVNAPAEPGGRLRVAYAGHDFLAGCLDELLATAEVEWVLCLTTDADGRMPSTMVQRRARDAGATIITSAPGPGYIAAVNESAVDLLVCAAYPHKIPVGALTVARAINIHPSLLPAGRGPNPLPHIVAAHRDAAGVSVHALTDIYDHGPILLQRRIDLAVDDGVDQLYLKLTIAARRALAAVLADVDGHLRAARFPPSCPEMWPDPGPERLLDATRLTVADARTAQNTFGMLFGLQLRLADHTVLEVSSLSSAPVAHGHPAGTIIRPVPGAVIIALRDGLAIAAVRPDASR